MFRSIIPAGRAVIAAPVAGGDDLAGGQGDGLHRRHPTAFSTLRGKALPAVSSCMRSDGVEGPDGAGGSGCAGVLVAGGHEYGGESGFGQQLSGLPLLPSHMSGDGDENHRGGNSASHNVVNTIALAFV